MGKATRILVFRFSSLGDIALAVPVVCEVLKQNPDCYIDFVTPSFAHDIFPVHDRLQLFTFDKKHKHKGITGLYALLKSFDLNKYEAVVDLHDVLRTKFLSSLSMLNRKKVFIIDKDRKSRNHFIKGLKNKPLLHTTEKYADVFRKAGLKVSLDHQLKNFLFDNIKKESSIGIAPFARHEGKRIDLDILHETAIVLSKKYQILIFASESELKTIESWTKTKNIQLFKVETLKEELIKMAAMQVMISMDSANMHLASLVGVPVVSIWGVTHPDAGFLGYGQRKDFVVQDESQTWRPTSIYGNKPGPKSNPNGMKNISTEIILQKVETVLKSNKNV